MAHDDIISNKSENRPFSDVLEKNASRRDVLKGGLALAATTFFGISGVSALAGGGRYGWRPGGLVNFEPVPLVDGNGAVPRISPDYHYQVLIPWGEPLEPGGPSYSWPPSAADQARQIGIGHDGMTYFPIHDDEDAARCGWDAAAEVWDNDADWHTNTQMFGAGNRHGMLCINHEFGGNAHVLGKDAPESLGDVQASQHAHGISVVELKRKKGIWQQVSSKRARRIHVNSEVTFSGPVAGSDLLKTPAGNVPRGTVNNCANGYTPWGTYLTCEENFNGYFGSTDLEAWEQDSNTATEAQQRYGFGNAGFGYGWEKYDARFDLANPDFKNEENRFGWVVEIDPMDATEMPVKRTALGRFKHEGAAVVVGKNLRVVVYMGDDQRFDYIYKFVSESNWREMRHNGKHPLDHGKLYVARFDDDGTGEWLELSIENPLLAVKFRDQAEVLTYARLAADELGATPMDRPEWTTVARDQWVYCTLTNNSQRTAPDAANPMAPNPDGHIIRWRDSDRHTGLKFEWEIFLIAEDTHGTEESYSDPDGLWADPDGRLFIQTDGGQKDGLNNQLLVCDIKTKEIRRLFTGVTGDEITGLTLTPDRTTLFINTQHPGNGDPTLTNFPVANEVPDGVTVPRDCTFVITRKDGGVIGS